MLQNLNFIDCPKIVATLEEQTLNERIDWVPVNLEYSNDGCYSYSCIVGGEYFTLAEGHLIGTLNGPIGYRHKHIAHCDQTHELTQAIENATNTKAGTPLTAWEFRGQPCPGIRCQRAAITFPTTATKFWPTGNQFCDAHYLSPPLELQLKEQLLDEFGNWPAKMMVDVDNEQTPLAFSFDVQFEKILDKMGCYESPEAWLLLRVPDLKDDQGNWPQRLSVGLRPL